MQRRLERLDESIARYLSQLETADRQGDAVPEAKIAGLTDKLAKLKEEIEHLNAINAELMESEDRQISLTDPDARSMATSGRDTAIVGYNVQTAVIAPACPMRYGEPLPTPGSGSPSIRDWTRNMLGIFIARAPRQARRAAFTLSAQNPRPRSEAARC